MSVVLALQQLWWQRGSVVVAWYNSWVSGSARSGSRAKILLSALVPFSCALWDLENTEVALSVVDSICNRDLAQIHQRLVILFHLGLSVPYSEWLS